jgi:hypothetical protein
MVTNAMSLSDVAGEPYAMCLQICIKTYNPIPGLREGRPGEVQVIPKWFCRSEVCPRSCTAPATQ